MRSRWPPEPVFSELVHSTGGRTEDLLAALRQQQPLPVPPANLFNRRTFEPSANSYGEAPPSGFIWQLNPSHLYKWHCQPAPLQQAWGRHHCHSDEQAAIAHSVLVQEQARPIPGALGNLACLANELTLQGLSARLDHLTCELRGALRSLGSLSCLSSLSALADLDEARLVRHAHAHKLQVDHMAACLPEQRQAHGIAVLLPPAAPLAGAHDADLASTMWATRMAEVAKRRASELGQKEQAAGRGARPAAYQAPPAVAANVQRSAEEGPELQQVNLGGSTAGVPAAQLELHGHPWPVSTPAPGKGAFQSTPAHMDSRGRQSLTFRPYLHLCAVTSSVPAQDRISLKTWMSCKVGSVLQEREGMPHLAGVAAARHMDCGDQSALEEVEQQLKELQVQLRHQFQEVQVPLP